MNTFRYDGTFTGFLSLVFKVYETKLEPSKIEKMMVSQPVLFGRNIDVDSNEEVAERVKKGIVTKLGFHVYDNCYRAFLTHEVGIELTLFNFIKLGLEEGRGFDENYTNGNCLKVKQLNKSIRREVHRMHAFTRFQQTADGLYFASIMPDFDVLPLIAEHFQKRYADQHWLIYDTIRKKGIFYDTEEVIEIALEGAQYNALTGELLQGIKSETEDQYKQLWSNYFSATNIVERRNLKLHIKHVPKRYWKFLSEKYNVLKGAA